MSKKVLNIVFVTLIVVAIALITFLMIFYKMGYNSFMGTMIVTMSYGFINIVLMLIKVIYKNEIKRLTAAIYASIVFIGVLGYYVIKYIGHYEDAKIIYWVVYFSVLGLTISIMTVINFKLKGQKLAYTRGKK